MNKNFDLILNVIMIKLGTWEEILYRGKNSLTHTEI